MTKVTVILPAYNEEISIGSMVIGAKKYAENLIVVDDGSNDKTSEIAQYAGAHVIEHPYNMGKGAALKTGFKAGRDADIVVTMDADGQHNPDDIPKLIKPIINGEADMVNGSRYVNGNGKNTPTYRRIGQKVLDRATSLNGDIKVTDSQSGFRAFARHTLPAFRFKSTGYGIESEMLIDAANAGLKVKEMEIHVRYNLNGPTKNPVTHGLGVLIKILNEIEFKRPLAYFGLPGAIIIVVGLVLGLDFFGDYLAKESTSLAPTILAMSLIFAGAFLAFTGLILDSMSKMVNNIMNTGK